MHVYFGPALYRWAESSFINGCLRLADHAGRVGVPLTISPQSNDALIDRARSMVATRFLLDTTADVLLTIDGDIEFRPEDALEICRQAMDHDIVAGLYVTRGRDRRCAPTSLLLRGAPIEFAGDPTPREILYAATGFLAVHRRVFEALAARADLPLCHPKTLRFHPFYLPFLSTDEDGGPIELSEDYALCARAREAGFSVWLNPRVRIGHAGQQTYYLEHLADETPPVQPMQLERVTTAGYRIGAPTREPAIA